MNRFGNPETRQAELILTAWALVEECGNNALNKYEIMQMISARISMIAEYVWLSADERDITAKTVFGMWKATRNIP